MRDSRIADARTANCDKCIHRLFHPRGWYYAVIEGHDDPYEYWYCEKGHWYGPISGVTFRQEDTFPMTAADDCVDYAIASEGK